MKQQQHAPNLGFDDLVMGLKRLPEPGIRSFVLIPLAINILVFSFLIWFAVQQFSGMVDQLMAWLPSWLGFLDVLLWPLFAVAVLLGLFFGFTMIANLIAAPFNGFLAEKIQRELDPGSVPDGGWQELVALLPRTMAREVQKMIYFLPRVLGLFIISLIPLVNLASPLFWALFSAWMMGVQYCDYAADNEQVSFREMLARLARPRAQTMVFGGSVAVLNMIPLVNLIVMPAAVIGGTYLWVRRRSWTGEAVD